MCPLMGAALSDCTLTSVKATFLSYALGQTNANDLICFLFLPILAYTTAKCLNANVVFLIGLQKLKMTKIRNHRFVPIPNIFF